MKWTDWDKFVFGVILNLVFAGCIALTLLHGERFRMIGLIFITCAVIVFMVWTAVIFIVLRRVKQKAPIVEGENATILGWEPTSPKSPSCKCGHPQNFHQDDTNVCASCDCEQYVPVSSPRPVCGKCGGWHETENCWRESMMENDLKQKVALCPICNGTGRLGMCPCGERMATHCDPDGLPQCDMCDPEGAIPIEERSEDELTQSDYDAMHDSDLADQAEARSEHEEGK